jgi:polysaccharide biosynthesis protein PslG
MTRWFLQFSLVLLHAVCLTPSSVFAAQEPDFILGVCNHLAHGRSTAEQSVRAMTNLGANSFRDDAFWSFLETEKNVLRWPQRLQELERAIDLANQQGIEPVVILAYENRFHHEGRYPTSDEAQAAFARYAEFVVRRFKGRVRYYEVWNEWNQHGGAADYARLLKRVYPAIKRIDSNAIVLGGAVEGAAPPKFIRAMMEQGTLPFMDGLSVHPYVFWRGRSGTPEAMYQWMVDLQAMLRQYSSGRDVPIYITEIGWPTNTSAHGISEVEAADYVAQMVLMMRSLPYVKGVWWYNLFNKGTNPKDHELNFGLLTEDGQAKPAFHGFAQISELARKAQFVRRENTSAGTWAMRFTNPEGDETLAVFSTRNTRVSVQLPSLNASSKIEVKTLQPPLVKGASSESKSLLAVSSTPILLRGAKDALNNVTFSTDARP